MHEWSLAEAVVRAVLALIEQRGASRASELEVVYGKLMGLDPDLMAEAIRELSVGSPLEGAEVKIVEEPARIRCRSCGSEFSLSSVDIDGPKILEEGHGRENLLHFLPDLAPALLRCPRCGSSDLEVDSGGSLRISRVVLEWS